MLNSHIAPIQEDLTSENVALEITRGLESMIRADKPLKAGVTFELGEWGVLNASGEMEKATATPVPQTYLIWSSTNRLDVKATGNVTIIQNSGVVAETRLFKTDDSYPVGAPLTVKLVLGKSILCVAGVGEPILARVVSKVGDVLEFETRAA